MLEELIEAARQEQAAGHWDDAIAGYEAALRRVPGEGDAGQTADIMRRIGIVHRDRGDLDLAMELCEASLCIAELCALPDREASALICIATIHQMRGELNVSEGVYSRAGEIARGIGDERLAAMVEQNLGVLANIRGDIAFALRNYAAALERYERLGDLLAASQALNCMAMAHVDRGEWKEAEWCFDRAQALAEDLRDTGMLGSIQINLAELHLKRGDSERARESCDRAFEIFGRLGSDWGLAEVYKFYGVLYRETGKPLLADSHFGSAIRLAQECQDRLLEAESLREWALVHLAEKRNREALQCLNSAHHLFSELSARQDLLDLDRRLDGLEATYLRVVRAWGESIESKDRYTAGHCERVANYACLLAEAVGYGGRDLSWFRMGGYLHDVGKIAVPSEVLNKPGKLTPEEWAKMQDHTVEGDRIVAELNFPWDIRPVVRSHHERWDGTGYPDRLKGEEIPLTARILCVADVYDALTTTRSYRPALSQEEALRIMEGDSGRLFDPALFTLFRSLITGTAASPASPLHPAATSAAA